MNERIRELMRESGVKTLFPGDPGAGQQGPKGVSAGLSDTEKLEKFAELIIKECAQVAWLYDEPKLSGHGSIIANRIESHFGVE